MTLNFPHLLAETLSHRSSQKKKNIGSSRAVSVRRSDEFGFHVSLAANA